jgi:hypothetical protein
VFGPNGGTKETAMFAGEIGKPLLHLMSSLDINNAATRLNIFVKEHGIAVMNVAGPRKSEEPGLGRFVHAVLSLASNQVLPEC